MSDPRVEVRAFLSDELDDRWNELIEAYPEWRGRRISRVAECAKGSVVFFPYFPFGRYNAVLLSFRSS